MSNELVGVGVVGYGYWGPNLVRNFANSESSRVIGVSDLDPAKLAASKRLHSDIVTTTDFRDLLQDPGIDAVAIATPVHTHYDLALSALKAGKG
jgi:predicted dehydrogenase